MLLFKLTQCFTQQLFFQHTPKLSKDLNYSTQKMEKKNTTAAFNADQL